MALLLLLVFVNTAVALLGILRKYTDSAEQQLTEIRWYLELAGLGGEGERRSESERSCDLHLISYWRVCEEVEDADEGRKTE